MSVSVGKSSIVSSNLVLYLDPSLPSSFTINEVEVLVVAGGGGGGGRHAGGGGGGGLIYVNSYSVTPGSVISVTVGSGGAAAPYGGRGGNGQDSIFGSLTAIGGGGGGGYADGAATVIGASGGSGGGGAGANGLPGGNGSGGAGTAGQGNRGGDPWSSGWPGGGGGGAGAPGQSPRNGLYGGRGGDGLLYSISGYPRYYAGGGGGGGENNIDLNGGLGGLGGGGRATGAFSPTQGQAGQANTGGGGGGSRDQAGTAGGSGVVIVRYPGPQKATGGTITQVGGFTIHTFNSSGTFTPLTQTQLRTTFYGLQDLSGNNNSAFKSGTITYSSNNNGSIVFDGTTGYLTYKTPLNVGNTFTLNFWIKPTNKTRQTIFSNAYPYSTNKGFFICCPGNNGTDMFLSLGQDQKVTSSSIGSIQTNVIQMITAVANGSNSLMKLYVNGVEVSYATQADANITLDYDSDIFTTGRRGLSNADYANSEMYSLQIYNRALSVQEIQQNFNTTRGRFGV